MLKDLKQGIRKTGTGIIGITGKAIKVIIKKIGAVI